MKLPMLPKVLLLSACALLLAWPARAEWRLAEPGWEYVFPRDHGPHREFKTEWWYFTGNLQASNGRRYGFQITFFRQGMREPAQRAATTSRFVLDDLKFAHFALSDPAGGRFRFSQKLSRGAFGEAGFGTEKLAWIEDWQLTLQPDGSMLLSAGAEGAALSLKLRTDKPWAVQGENGISQKAAGTGHASHYYSGTRMKTEGSLQVDGKQLAVSGETWFDHEWATNQLAPGQIGWNWFSIQLADGSELMLYQMRTRDGGTDPSSSGSFIAADGTVRHLRREDYELVPEGVAWTSPASGGRYPISWTVSVPSLQLKAKVTTPLPSQELVLKPIAYWEGMIDVEGTRAGQPLRGHGYMELTGYAGALVGLSAEAPGKP